MSCAGCLCYYGLTLSSYLSLCLPLSLNFGLGLRSQVGEHLLSLLQNLEPFANCDAFQDAVGPTQDLHLLTEPAWRYSNLSQAFLDD